jgi:hypothetical protein
MSEKDKQEMVTIEVPLEWAKLRASKPITPHQGVDPSHVDAACRAALEARKTKLERWREAMGFPWELNIYSLILLRADSARDVLGDCTTDEARLMAAAPQLLEALIAEYLDPGNCEQQRVSLVEGALKAALPEDVADEVLGE